MNPIAYFALHSQATRLMMDTQTVMAIRLMGMSGFVPSRTDENYVMMAEKGPAMMRALAAGNAALMAGKSPDKILSAAIKPLARKVSANRKRLMK